MTVLLTGIFIPGNGQNAGSGETAAGFGGQAIGWTTVNPSAPFQVQAGLRYMPEISLTMPVGKYSLEGEFSANLWGSGTWYPGDSLYTDGEISPYRLWLRFSGDQLEIRAGLQKINFGSAVLFRPLMWFDRIDPRDPLQLTDGVYGLLGRYYFLNNMNIWLWGIYGNGQTKGWEIIPSRKKSIEYGGRFQAPLFTGEVAATYHHRTADPSGVIPDSVSNGDMIPENRIALDAKFDMGVGFWVEGALIHQQAGYTDLRFRTLLNGGLDYTFNLGNGLGLMTEFFGFLQGEDPLHSDQHMTFVLLSVNYPLNIIHDLGAMVFYNFSNNAVYRFVNWSITFDRWSFYIMGFWNPDTYQLYNLDYGSALYGGAGFQLMAVFNH